jgi:hypothetical protein
MEIDFKVRRKILFDMEKEDISIMMEVTILVTGLRVRWKDRESSLILMVI